MLSVSVYNWLMKIKNDNNDNDNNNNGLRLHGWALNFVSLSSDADVVLCMVDTLGAHTLSYQHNPGRFQRHRPLQKADFPSVEEPHGLITSDGKHPDGRTIIPWCRCATWHLTVTGIVTATYLVISFSSVASAAEAAQLKARGHIHRNIPLPPYFRNCYSDLWSHQRSQSGVHSCFVLSSFAAGQ